MMVSFGIGITKQDKDSHGHHLPSQERQHELEAERNKDCEQEGEETEQRWGVVSGGTGREGRWLGLAKQKTSHPASLLPPQPVLL